MIEDASLCTYDKAPFAAVIAMNFINVCNLIQFTMRKGKFLINNRMGGGSLRMGASEVRSKVWD